MLKIHSVASECETGAIEAGVRLDGDYHGGSTLTITRTLFVDYDPENHEEITRIENMLLRALIPTLQKLDVDTSSLLCRERHRYLGDGDYRDHAWVEKIFTP